MPTSQSTSASLDAELERLSAARRQGGSVPSMLNSQEHIDLISMFERLPAVKGFRLDKEAKDLWPKGHIYQHGELNELFLMYRHGFAYGKAVFRV
jgi:hypothetical protein